MNHRIRRRSFLVRTSGAAIAASITPASLPGIGRVGVNERVRLGWIGTGGRGRHHIRDFRENFPSEVDIVALCDVDPRNLEQAAVDAGGSTRKTAEFRDVIDAKDIDAVIVATPDHWHAIPAIRACEAGKDVYVEKPIGHNVREGRLVADAAKKHGRVVATGLQQRSGPHFIEAVRRIREGEIGRVTFVHAWNAWDVAGMGGDLGNPPDEDPPKGVDYDRWLGPAPKRAFNPRRFHFSFYFFWDYSGGMMSAWGVHLFDVVAWALGSKLRSVGGIGGKLAHDDIRETHDTADVSFECSDFVLNYSMRHGNGFPPYGDMDHGLDFHGTEGTLRINRRGFTIHPEDDRSRTSRGQEEGMDIPHKRDWLDCLRSRAKPNCDAEEGHVSSLYGHLANISLRLRRRVHWDQETETIAGDTEAAALLRREYRDPWVL